MNSSTVTEEERQRYLDQLQAETTIIMIPAVVFLATLAVVGFIGNSLVIVVYTHRKKWSATTILIITLACLDLMANVVAIPAYIYDMFHAWQYDNRTLCRVQIFSSTFLTSYAGMVLLAVSVVRYRKVCKSQKWQVTARGAKIICAVLLVLGLIFSIPHVLTRGRQTKKTPRNDIVGYECKVDDEYAGTIYPLLSLCFLIVIYLVCCGFLVVMYIRIGMKAYQHRVIHGARRPSFSETTSTPFGFRSDFKVPQKSSSFTSFASSVESDINMCAKAPITVDRTSNAQQGGQRYDLRLSADRVEIRTLKAGEFLVNLQKEKSELCVLGLRDCEISKHKIQKNEERIQHDSSSQREKAAGDTANEESKTSNTTAGKEQIRVLSNIKSNTAYTENITTDHAFRGEGVEENLRLCDEISKTAIISDSGHRSEITNLSYGHTVQNHCNSSTYDRQSLYKEDSIDSNPLSVFKWLDVIYCSDVHDISLNSNVKGNEANLSFRLFINHSKSQSTGSLRSTRRSPANSGGAEDDAATRPNAEIDMVNVWKDKHENVVNEILEIPVASSTSDIQNKPKNASIGGPYLRGQSITSMLKRPKWNRTTTMLIVISIFYAIGYFPSFGLLFYQFLYPGSLQNMSTAGKSIYILSHKTFFLNCAVNPIVYSLCDHNFRNECKQLFKSS